MNQVQIYHGNLDAECSTGTEGILWVIFEHNKEGYQGLHLLEKDDYLIVYVTGTQKALWSGYIEPDYTINVERSPHTTRMQPSVMGYWCRWLPRGIEPKVWANFFFTEMEATLIKLQ